MSSDSIYFALEEPSAKVNILLKKADSWGNAIVSNNYLDKCRASWMAYYGAQHGGGIALGASRGGTSSGEPNNRERGQERGT